MLVAPDASSDWITALFIFIFFCKLSRYLKQSKQFCSIVEHWNKARISYAWFAAIKWITGWVVILSTFFILHKDKFILIQCLHSRYLCYLLLDYSPTIMLLTWILKKDLCDSQEQVNTCTLYPLFYQYSSNIKRCIVVQLLSIQGEVRGKGSFYKYSWCSLTERILSLSCWMERQRMENNPLSLWKGVFLLALAKSGGSERKMKKQHWLWKHPPCHRTAGNNNDKNTNRLSTISSIYALFHNPHAPEQLTPGSRTCVTSSPPLFRGWTIYIPIYVQNTVTRGDDNTTNKNASRFSQLCGFSPLSPECC